MAKADKSGKKRSTAKSGALPAFDIDEPRLPAWVRWLAWP